LLYPRTRCMVKRIGKFYVIISAFGAPVHIKAEHNKDGAIVIDVGNTMAGDKLVGDVDFDAAKEKAGWITPVPGGVGPLTITMVLNNTLLAAKWHNGVE